MYLWKHYGITSYNFGNSGEPMPVTYWQMRMALDYCTPKVVVVDVFSCDGDVLYNDEKNNNSHLSFDYYPLSITKIKAVHDLIKDRDIELEYIFNLSLYHNRWDELEKKDFKYKASEQKGTWAYGSEESYFIPCRLEQQKIVSDTADVDDELADQTYIKKIIEFCLERRIPLILTHNPYVCYEERQKYANSVGKIAKEFDIPYLNFVQMDSVIDFQTDMMDWSHTNPSGMNKISDYIGNYIVNNYEIEDHRKDEYYDNWNNDYLNFLDLKNSTIIDCEDGKSLLELLHDDDYSCFIYINGESILAEDEQLKRLLNNINRRHIYSSDASLKSENINELELVDVAFEQKKDYFLAINSIDGDVYESLGDNVEGVMLKTKFQYQCAMQDSPSLYYEIYNNNLLSYEGEEPDLQIIVLSNLTGEVIKKSQWIAESRMQLNIIQ